MTALPAREAAVALVDTFYASWPARRSGDDGDDDRAALALLGRGVTTGEMRLMMVAARERPWLHRRVRRLRHVVQWLGRLRAIVAGRDDEDGARRPRRAAAMDQTQQTPVRCATHAEWVELLQHAVGLCLLAAHRCVAPGDAIRAIERIGEKARSLDPSLSVANAESLAEIPRLREAAAAKIGERSAQVEVVALLDAIQAWYAEIPVGPTCHDEMRRTLCAHGRMVV